MQFPLGAPRASQAYGLALDPYRETSHAAPARNNIRLERAKKSRLRLALSIELRTAMPFQRAFRSFTNATPKVMGRPCCTWSCAPDSAPMRAPRGDGVESLLAPTPSPTLFWASA